MQTSTLLLVLSHLPDSTIKMINQCFHQNALQALPHCDAVEKTMRNTEEDPRYCYSEPIVWTKMLRSKVPVNTHTGQVEFNLQSSGKRPWKDPYVKDFEDKSMDGWNFLH